MAMFNNEQIQSYHRITAPADLKQKVMNACEATTDNRTFPFRKAIYGFAPLAACVLLFLFLWTPNNRQTLELTIEGTPLTADSMSLPYAAEPAVAMARSYSQTPAQYTVTLAGNQTMELLSADGFASFSENGDIVWTVEIPSEDMVFELFLLSGEDTYYIPLRYHVQDGSFSIHYETK